MFLNTTQKQLGSVGMQVTALCFEPKTCVIEFKNVYIEIRKKTNTFDQIRAVNCWAVRNKHYLRCTLRHLYFSICLPISYVVINLQRICK